MSDDVTTIFLGNAGPQISRSISELGGSDYDIVDGQTFKLRARMRDDAVVFLDADMTADVDHDVVFYNPTSSDFTVEGPVRAWIHVVDLDQDVAEFDILVVAHAPGVGARVGVVYRAARGLSPVAWDALRGYVDYGDGELQRAIELAKVRVFQHVVAVADEAAMDVRVVDYIAKKCLVDNVLPAVIDFWTNQLVTQTALGNSTEVKTYPDRIRAIEDQIKRFKQDLADQLNEIEAILGPVGTILDGPVLIGGGPLLTPGLGEMARIPPPLPWIGGWVR